MAKKKRVTKTITAKVQRDVKAVRLELSLADHGRLERRAREIGLSMASYARMALLERLKTDEMKGGAT